jgi:threonine dehydrogenase-like Zn-dependent dehydrogenase
MLHALPDAVSFVAGALVEPIAVGWHGAEVGGLDAGQTVLIVGGGPIGLGALLSARALDAGLTIVSANSEGLRTAMAREFGADLVLVRGETQISKRVRRHTSGLGVDLALEASGTQAGLVDAIRSVRIGGTVIILGLQKGAAEVDTTLLLLRELTLKGSRAYAGEYQHVIDAMADGRIQRPERMVTSCVSLESAIDSGFDQLAADRTNQVKVLVTPG